MKHLLNDDHTDIAIVRPSSYGYAQPNPQHVSHKKKHPLGFTQHDTKKQPKKK